MNGGIFPRERKRKRESEFTPGDDFRRVCGCRPFTFRSVVEDNGLELGRVLRRRVKIGLRLAGSHYNNSEPAVSFMAWFRLLCHRAKPRLTYLSLQTALLPLFLQPPCLCQFNTRIIPLLPHLPAQNFASKIGPLLPPSPSVSNPSVSFVRKFHACGNFASNRCSINRSLKRIDYRLFNLQICPRFLSIAFVRNDRKSNVAFRSTRRYSDWKRKKKEGKRIKRVDPRTDYQVGITLYIRHRLTCISFVFFFSSLSIGPYRRITRENVYHRVYAHYIFHLRPAADEGWHTGGGGVGEGVNHTLCTASIWRKTCALNVAGQLHLLQLVSPYFIRTTSTRPGDGNPV